MKPATGLASAPINLDHPGTYLHWSIFTVSVANLVLIAVMVVIFGAALLLPFPRGRTYPAQADLPPGADPAGERLTAGRGVVQDETPDRAAGAEIDLQDGAGDPAAPLGVAEDEPVDGLGRGLSGGTGGAAGHRPVEREVDTGVGAALVGQGPRMCRSPAADRSSTTGRSAR